MEKLKKLFGGINMTWPKVLIMAVVTAAYTALINQVPFLKNTSFQDIAVTPECWILFAMIIIMNCKKWWEASLKCFVFFLVSQPLIYLIEVPFVDLGWQIFQYYKHWAVITVLTLPGAAVAFLVKKKNWLSVLVLSVATGYLAYAAIDFGMSAVFNFPYHLLSAIFCLALALFFVFALLEDKKQRIAAVAIIAVVMAGTLAYSLRGVSQTILLGSDSGSWSCSVEDESIVSVKIDETGKAKITSKHDGSTFAVFKCEDGSERTYHFIVGGGNIFSTMMDDE